MLDIDGFLTSTPFLSQLAALISAIISAVLGGILTGLFGVA